MSKLVERVKEEVRSVIPPTLFFFVGFELLALTKALVLKQYGIEIQTFVAAAIGALVVAKVILVVDHLPFVSRFPDKPLVYNVVWKSFLYLIAAFAVRYLEHLIRFLSEHGDLATANAHLLEEVVWAHFWVVQVWLSVYLLIYCAVRELIDALGRERILGMYFGARETGA